MYRMMCYSAIKKNKTMCCRKMHLIDYYHIKENNPGTRGRNIMWVFVCET